MDIWWDIEWDIPSGSYFWDDLNPTGQNGDDLGITLCFFCLWKPWSIEID